MGDPASGIELLLRALELYQQLEDVPGQAATLNRIGVAFYDNGQLDEAQHAYERSLALHPTGQEDDEAARAELHNNLAKVLTDRGDDGAALEYLRSARRGFAAIDEQRGLGMTFHNAAVVSERQGDMARAVDQLRESIELYTAAGHTHGACEARTRLGVLLGRSSDDAEAVALLRRAHRDATELGLDRECARAAEALADLHEARGDPAEALIWFKYLRDLERQLFDAASDQRLRSLQVRYQLERLEHASITDALTGLLNRRGLDRALLHATEQARDTGEPLSLLLFDLDDFKQVNDRFSHAVGDDVLRQVGQLLRANARPTDLCARFGGEEFVVVLPDTDLAEARGVADERCAVIRGYDWGGLTSGLRVTTSVGTASWDRVTDRSALLATADRALYAAKGAGKDRAV